MQPRIQVSWRAARLVSVPQVSQLAFRDPPLRNYWSPIQPSLLGGAQSARSRQHSIYDEARPVLCDVLWNRRTHKTSLPQHCTVLLSTCKLRLSQESAAQELRQMRERLPATPHCPAYGACMVPPRYFAVRFGRTHAFHYNTFFQPCWCCILGH